jgi:hypothetical protein
MIYLIVKFVVNMVIIIIIQAVIIVNLTKLMYFSIIISLDFIILDYLDPLKEYYNYFIIVPELSF